MHCCVLKLGLQAAWVHKLPWRDEFARDRAAAKVPSCSKYVIVLALASHLSAGVRDAERRGKVGGCS